MEFDYLSPPAHVEKKKKYATFKITPIGGPDEIVAWRKKQEAKEFAHRMRLENRDKRLTEFKASTGVDLATPTIHTTSWAEKQAFVKSEKVYLSRAAADVIQNPPWVSFDEPKKSFLNKAIDFVKSFFN